MIKWYEQGQPYQPRSVQDSAVLLSLAGIRTTNCGIARR